MDSSLMLQMW